MTPALREAFLENPEYVLALMFSAPDKKESQRQSVTIDFSEDGVTATVPRPERDTPAPQLLANKETIYSAIVMYQTLMDRGPDYTDSLLESARRFGRYAALRAPEFVPLSDRKDDRSEGPGQADTISFFNQIESGPHNLEVAVRKTRDALAFLEHEGLAIDPAFAPGLMVLTGLIPVHFSIRTPKGQRIYKEICVNAPYWFLKIHRGRNADGPFNDVDFRFRGIDIVKKAITAMATQYLDSEEEDRRRNGQPVVRRHQAPQLDGE
jgi:hypothetical protein